MNSEPTNRYVGLAAGKLSYRNICRALLIFVPLFGLAGIGLCYTDLNIYQQLFVEKLGCGCVTGFNTNDLTMTVGLTSTGLALASWWLAASGLSWKLRLVLTGIELPIVFFGFFVSFVRHNWWL